MKIIQAFKFCFYVPLSHLESVKEAVFAAGAGTIGNYDKCAWETAGTGQFQPLKGSDAYIGEVGRLERVDEVKVEMICAPDRIDAVVKSLIEAHPYETPAFEYWEISTVI